MMNEHSELLSLSLWFLTVYGRYTVGIQIDFSILVVAIQAWPIHVFLHRRICVLNTPKLELARKKTHREGFYFDLDSRYPPALRTV